jgi:hypothetical protein
LLAFPILFFVLPSLVSTVLYAGVVVERPNWSDGLKLLLSVGLLLAFTLPLLFEKDIVRLVPLFEKRVGDTRTSSSGIALAEQLSVLDDLAGIFGVDLLSSFAFSGDFHRQPIPWRKSSEGLRTVRRLRMTCERRKDLPIDATAVVSELRPLEAALERAESMGIGFCLVVDGMGCAHWDSLAAGSFE